ncbi:DNRLRE domain-containing protein [Aeoliella sp.]|uniref:PEP-CTERM sorting domain-containing protein n=1 Tax=Aeoliella sp. TaxID=2795800 RepID=UPI003CCBCB36
MTLAILLTAIFSAGLASADILVLTPTDDAILRESATSPQGGNPLVIIGDTTNANDFLRSAFAFDLSGAELAGATINNVTLRLTADRTDTSSQNADVVIDFHELSASFTNDDVTWTSRNGIDNWTTPGGDFGGVIASLTANAATVSPGDELEWSSAPLASATQDAIGGSLYLIGKLNVEDSSTRNAFFFESLSAVGAEPELIIDYTSIPEPGSLALIGLGGVIVLLRRRN